MTLPRIYLLAASAGCVFSTRWFPEGYANHALFALAGALGAMTARPYDEETTR